jgi:hypothetical protein
MSIRKSLFIALATTIICLAAFPSNTVTSNGEEKLVLAFYYPWYRTVEHSGYCSWNFGGNEYEDRDKDCASNNYSPHMPRGGLYDSLDPNVVKRHLDQSRQAGIDGWIFSWWGIGRHADSLDLVLSVIKERDPDFRVTVYYEQIPGCSGYSQCTEVGRKDRINAVVKDFKFLEEKYFSHPAFLHADGRPVVFIYSRAMLQGMTDWPSILKRFKREGMDYYLSADAGWTWVQPFSPLGFDQVHFYNQLNQLLVLSPGLLKYRGYVVGAHLYGRAAAVTVIPGYDDHLVPGRQPLLLTRNDGETYQKVWENAIAADPDWILITSFNEWYEGTEIEPSEENGDLYLEMTREYAERFKSVAGR